MRGGVLPILNSALCLGLMGISVSFFLFPWTGVYAARAHGDSMLPTIPTDAFLILGNREPVEGDVVHIKSYGADRSDGANFVHRVVELRGEMVVTKGDNCIATETSRRGDVRGVVLYAFPFSAFLVLVLFVVGTEALLAVTWSGELLLAAHAKIAKT